MRIVSRILDFFLFNIGNLSLFFFFNCIKQGKGKMLVGGIRTLQ